MTSPQDSLAAVERDLSDVASMPLQEQAEVFERAHRALVEALDMSSPQVTGQAAGPMGDLR